MVFCYEFKWFFPFQDVIDEVKKIMQNFLNWGQRNKTYLDRLFAACFIKVLSFFPLNPNINKSSSCSTCFCYNETVLFYRAVAIYKISLEARVMRQCAKWSLYIQKVENVGLWSIFVSFCKSYVP